MDHKKNIFMLWIGDTFPELQQLSVKSLLLTNHKVKLFVYQDYPEIDYLKIFDNLSICDANDILPSNKIWNYTISNFGKGSVSGFANHWRLVYLKNRGGTWVDLDVLAIRNFQETYHESEIVIGSEMVGSLNSGKERPNNNLLSFPPNDPLVNKMLDIAEDIGQNAKHAETGPKLLAKLLRSKDWSIYSKFVLPYLAVGPIIYNRSRSFVKDSPEKVCKEQRIDINQVYGFHVWNTYFTVNTKKDVFKEMNESSIYAILRNAIMESNTRDEYISRIKLIFKDYKNIDKKIKLW